MIKEQRSIFSEIIENQRLNPNNHPIFKNINKSYHLCLGPEATEDVLIRTDDLRLIEALWPENLAKVDFQRLSGKDRLFIEFDDETVRKHPIRNGKISQSFIGKAFEAVYDKERERITFQTVSRFEDDDGTECIFENPWKVIIFLKHSCNDASLLQPGMDKEGQIMEQEWDVIESFHRHAGFTLNEIGLTLNAAQTRDFDQENINRSDSFMDYLYNELVHIGNDMMALIAILSLSDELLKDKKQKRMVSGF